MASGEIVINAELGRAAGLRQIADEQIGNPTRGEQPHETLHCTKNLRIALHIAIRRDDDLASLPGDELHIRECGFAALIATPAPAPDAIFIDGQDLSVVGTSQGVGLLGTLSDPDRNIWIADRVMVAG